MKTVITYVITAVGAIMFGTGIGTYSVLTAEKHPHKWKWMALFLVGLVLYGIGFILAAID